MEQNETMNRNTDSRRPNRDYYDRSEPRPVYRDRYPEPVEMTTGQWVLTLFLAGIPFVGFILLIVWAAGSSREYPARKAWAAATLIWAIIVVVLLFVLSTTMSLSFLSAVSG